MRDASWLQGSKELENIKRYAYLLDTEELVFVETIDKKVKAFVNNEESHLPGLDDVVKLRNIEEKYQYLKPFVFLFDPRKSMPRIVNNRAAFIIWTVWRSSHLLGQEDLNGAALSSANVLSECQPPYSPEVKDKAIKIFKTIMEESAGHMASGYSEAISFWHNKIFKYLEGVWEFKWELKS